MDPLTLVDVLLVFTFVSISAVLATGEFAFFSASRDALTRSGDKRSSAVMRMLDRPQELLINLLVGTSIVNAAAVFFALRIAWRAFPEGKAWVAATVLAIVISALMVAIFSRLLPRIYVAHNPETAAQNLAGPVFALLVPIYPLVKTVLVMTRGLFLAGIQARELLLKAGELRAMARAEVGGEPAREERAMINAIFEMRDTIAREVMVPRIDMVCAESSTAAGEAMRVINQGGHSRIPVYTRTVDNIAGILHAKDLFKLVAEGSLSSPIGGIVREAYFVPESKRIKELLQELRSRKTHMAIVVDEFGGVVGLVTVEDVLEQIVGEIYDEHEVESRTLVVLNDDSVRVDGKARIDEVNEALKINIKKEEDYDTIAGFLYSLVGKVPAEGEEYESDGLRFVIEKVTGQRIERVLIKGAAIGRAARETGQARQGL